MKILVFGAGPLGSLLAARLYEAGQDVHLLARGQRFEDIKKHGVVIKEEGRDKQEVAWPKLVEAFHPQDDYDLVMIVMRKNHADKILGTLAKNSVVPTFLFMGNNAAGPEDMIRALGKERVMLGFPLPGGDREGPVMRVLAVNEKNTYTLPIGEVDGRIRPRTREIARVLSSMRGYQVQIRRDMPHWLKYHVALLMPGFVPAIYGANNEMKRLGRTRDLMVLAVRATKEALRGLRQTGVPPSPAGIRALEYVPEPVLVSLIGWIMGKEFAKSSVEGHPRAARDEMTYLYHELLTTLEGNQTNMKAIDELKKYYDPHTPPLPEGSREIKLAWGGVITPLLLLLLIGAVKRAWDDRRS